MEEEKINFETEEEAQAYAKQIEKELEDEYTEYKENMLDAAYEASPKEYNEVFDHIERTERNGRIENGEASINDILDDMEDKREQRDHNKSM